MKKHFIFLKWRRWFDDEHEKGFKLLLFQKVLFFWKKWKKGIFAGIYGTLPKDNIHIPTWLLSVKANPNNSKETTTIVRPSVHMSLVNNKENSKPQFTFDISPSPDFEHPPTIANDYIEVLGK